jgi:hypothetical protein
VLVRRAADVVPRHYALNRGPVPCPLRSHRRIEPLENKPDAVDEAEKARCWKLQKTPWNLWKMWGAG